MDIRVYCQNGRCPGECQDHAYCEGCMQEKLEEARKQGEKEGYETARKQFEQ